MLVITSALSVLSLWFQDPSTPHTVACPFIRKQHSLLLLHLEATGLVLVLKQWAAHLVSLLYKAVCHMYPGHGRTGSQGVPLIFLSVCNITIFQLEKSVMAHIVGCSAWWHLTGFTGLFNNSPVVWLNRPQLSLQCGFCKFAVVLSATYLEMKHRTNHEAQPLAPDHSSFIHFKHILGYYIFPACGIASPSKFLLYSLKNWINNGILTWYGKKHRLQFVT